MGLVNDGMRVQSVASIFGWIFTIGGETKCWPGVVQAMEAFAQLRDFGVTLSDELVEEMVRVGEVLVCGVKLKFRFTFCVDGAFMFKLCDGPCGGSSITPCPECDCVRNRGTKKSNIHYAMIKIEVRQGDSTQSFSCHLSTVYALHTKISSLHEENYSLLICFGFCTETICTDWTVCTQTAALQHCY